MAEKKTGTRKRNPATRKKAAETKPAEFSPMLSKNEQLLLRMLRRSDETFARISEALNISKDNVSDIATNLCKAGYDVRAYVSELTKEHSLRLHRTEDLSLEALPISLTNRKMKIAFISELRMGATQAQVSMLKWLYEKVFEPEAVDFVVVVGGTTVGKPTATIKPDIFKGDAKDPWPLANYVTTHFPATKVFKTYLVSNRRELTYKTEDGINFLELIAANRDDLAYIGDLEKTFDVHGLRIKVMAPWDDNSPKSISYGPQKIVDNLSDDPAPKIIVCGGMHKRCELVDYGENATYVYGVPSLHTQMLRQQRKGVRPRLGCLILELEFNKDWSFDVNTGLKARFLNLDPYAKPNDCFADISDLTHGKKLRKGCRQILEWFVNERVIAEGELSRRINKSKEYVRKVIALINKRAKVNIDFSDKSKRYELPLIEKKAFKALPMKPEDIFRPLTKVGGISCTHYGSEHELPEAVRQAYQDAAGMGVRRVFHAGDVTEGPGASGYRGHQNDVKFSGLDDLEDHTVSLWPRVMLKNDPNRPLMKSVMTLNEKGQPAYREVVVKDNESPLQTDIIDGNHDCWAKQTIGHRPVRTLALRMPELLRYLGPADGKISMDGAVKFEGVFHRLTHGDGGLGYSLSSKLQRHISSHRRRGVSKNMPTVLWFGNWHTNFLLFEDELGILLASFKSEDEFHLRKDLVSWVGMNIVELYGDANGHLTMVVSDYRNYRNMAVMNQ